MRKDKKKKKELKKEENTEEIKTRVEKNKQDDEEVETETKGLSIIKKIIILIAVIFIIIYIIAKLVYPNFVVIKETKYESSLLPNDFDGFKIVQISDIHYGTTINKDKLHKIVKEVNKLKPDIIIFTGDLFDKDISYSEDKIKDMEEELSQLEARLYKYAISGNEDTNNNDYYTIIDNANFILLDNKEKVLFNEGNNPIVIFGFSSFLESDPDYSILNNEEYKDYFKIVIMHEPDAIDNISNANLIFAGHSLGGIFNIGKPMIKYEGAKKYNNFENNIEETTMFISNGLGTNKLNMRFNNSPTINLYRIYNKTTD